VSYACPPSWAVTDDEIGDARNDPEAMSRTLERMRPMIRAAVAKAGGDHKDDDVWQVASVAAWKCLKSFDPAKGRLSTLVYLAVARALRDHEAVSRSGPPVGHLPGGLALREPPAETPGVAGLVEDSLAILEGEPEMREAVRLVYGEGLPCDEAARRMGLPQLRVMSLLAAAIHRLKKHLGVA
jgi:DNA-directed RNA polymerase specialized sigma24 family protein